MVGSNARRRRKPTPAICLDNHTKEGRQGMLVLTRKPGESIDVYIDGQTTPLMSFEISEMSYGESGKKVRIAFDIPSNVTILRSELGNPGQAAKQEGDAA